MLVSGRWVLACGGKAVGSFVYFTVHVLEIRHALAFANAKAPMLPRFRA
jgi:hypothetical protein